jgi:hypothetical protein
MAGLNHPLHDLDDLNLLGPSINEVAKENHLVLWMLPFAILYDIAKLEQQALEHRRIAVNVANYVVHGFP